VLKKREISAMIGNLKLETANQAEE